MKQEAVKKLDKEAAEKAGALRGIEQEQAAINERLRDYRQLATQAREALQEHAALPLLSLLNNKEVYKAASEKIELQKKALADRNILARRNQELEQQMQHNEVRSNEQIESLQHQITTMEAEHNEERRKRIKPFESVYAGQQKVQRRQQEEAKRQAKAKKARNQQSKDMGLGR